MPLYHKSSLLIAVYMNASSQLFAAPTIDISPIVVGVYDTDGNALPLPSDLQKLDLAKRVFEVQFVLSVSDLAPEDQGFGNVAFSINTIGSLHQASAPFPGGYSPINPLVDHDGKALTDLVPWFADNSDLGIANDLDNIVVGLDPVSLTLGDVRLGSGQTVPVPLGKLFVAFDGVTPGTAGILSVSFEGVSTIRDGQLFLAENPTLVSTALDFATVPEPSSVILSVLAIGTVKLRRKRLS
jgi:hypothetical protein